MLSHRRRAGVLSGDILDVINTWPEPRQTKAYQAIAELEEQVRLMKVIGYIYKYCGLKAADAIMKTSSNQVAIGLYAFAKAAGTAREQRADRPRKLFLLYYIS